MKRAFIRILNRMSDQMRDAVVDGMKHGLVVEWIDEVADKELIEVFMCMED